MINANWERTSGKRFSYLGMCCNGRKEYGTVVRDMNVMMLCVWTKVKWEGGAGMHKCVS